MKLPRRGPWVRIYWRDAEASDEWVDSHEESPRTIKVSVGMLLGVTSDEKVRLAPTVSMQICPAELRLKLSELEIPAGCIVKVEELPFEDIRLLVGGHKTERVSTCHFVPPKTKEIAPKRPKTPKRRDPSSSAPTGKSRH